MSLSATAVRVHRSSRPFLAAVLLVLSLAGVAAIGTAAAIANSRIQVKLTGENHHPIVNKPWTYSARVTTAAGKKLSGTVVGTEKPVNVRFKDGYYRDTIEFPAPAAGEPLSVEVVVHTKDGSGSALWSITVKQ
jgi:hypothetical protein